MLAVEIHDGVLVVAVGTFLTGAITYATWLAVQIMKLREEAGGTSATLLDHERRLDSIERLVYTPAWRSAPE